MLVTVDQPNRGSHLVVVVGLCINYLKDF